MGGAAQAAGVGVILALVSGCAGEPRRLAPAPPPQRAMPAVTLPTTPVAPNHGRVVLDTTAGPMRVAAKFDPTFIPPGGSTEKGASGELCVTPCVVDLPVGKYRLFFSAIDYSQSSLGDSDDLVVVEGLTVYRRAPGSYRTPSPVDQIGPAALLVLGSIAITAAAITAANRDEDATLPVGLAIGGGAALIGGGVWGYDRSRATQRDGSTTTWQVQPSH